MRGNIVNTGQFSDFHGSGANTLFMPVSREPKKYQTFATYAYHMPFCTSCGAEVSADKRFCVQCGAPMEQHAAPSAPAATMSPSHAPPVPLIKTRIPKNTLIIIGVLAIIVLLAAANFVVMPMIRANQNPAAGPLPTPAVTPTMVNTAQPTPEYTTALPVTTTTTLQQRDVRYEEDYEQIYTLNQKFAYGQKVNFKHNLTRPPLYIKFNLTPVMITRHRLVAIGTNNEHYENTTDTSPYAWFEIKVLDAGSGADIDQQGFGNDYSDVIKQDFMVRKPGNYRIEMSGNDVTADVLMMIGIS